MINKTKNQASMKKRRQTNFKNFSFSRGYWFRNLLAWKISINFISLRSS